MLKARKRDGKVEDFDIKFFLLGCKSSKKENIIATDKKILERYFK